MFFKLEARVRELYLNPIQTVPIVLEHGAGGLYHVSLQRSSGTTIESLTSDGVATVTCELQPPAECLHIFMALSKGELPTGITRDTTTQAYINDSGRLNELSTLPLKVFPVDYQLYASKLCTELAECANRSVTIIKWRLNGHGPYRPCTVDSFQFSVAGDTWASVYDVWEIGTDAWSGLERLDSIMEEIQALVTANEDEPLGHGLWREAWYMARSNPRAALMLGVSAVEVGVKNGLVRMMPETQWLFENIPSPDVEKMIRLYLSKLKNIRPKGTVTLLDPELCKRIQVGVQARNKVTHLGHIPDDKDFAKAYQTLHDVRKMKEFLWSVQQL